MARANWSTGYMQAAIYRALLTELGYDVSDPSQAELSPAEFYPALAEGRYDFWANGWIPHHVQYMNQEDVYDTVRTVGWQMPAGGLQGILMDKATADAYGITNLDDIGDNPELAALFDLDGDGKADLMGCDQSWACREIIDDTIAHNEWQETIEQVSANHADLFADSVRRHQRSERFLVYVWSPSTFTAQLVPGEDAIWLSMDSPLSTKDQIANLPANECPGRPCKTGFIPADIQVVARDEFLEANPAAAKLLNLVNIPSSDVSQYVHQYLSGNSSEADVQAAADQWIADNRVSVDRWLALALVAGGIPYESELFASMPTEGVRVRMARGNWPAAFVPAAIYQMLLQELGYEVNDLAGETRRQFLFYLDLFEGLYDFWANGWFPFHADEIQRYGDAFGSADAVQPIGVQTPAGGPHGFLLDKEVAERLGITMLDDIGNDPEVAALFDHDGNGKADVKGCLPDWDCEQWIDDTVARNGWEDTIDKVKHSWTSSFEEPVKQNNERLFLFFNWGHSSLLLAQVPGRDLIWLSVGNPLPEHAGETAFSAEECPAQPCTLGFAADDIRVVANRDFLDANPAAAKLFELVVIPAEDVWAQYLAFFSGGSSKADIRARAEQWIADNRAYVDQWLDEARAVG